MKTLTFTIEINAPKQKVWEAMWNDASYREWTAPFSPGSHAISDWEEESIVQFLNPENNGMYAVIEKKVLYEQMTFKHLGEVKNGIFERKDWGGAKESYFLTEKEGITTLTSNAYALPQFEQFFSSVFPKALVILKQIAER